MPRAMVSPSYQGLPSLSMKAISLCSGVLVVQGELKPILVLRPHDSQKPNNFIESQEDYVAKVHCAP